LSIDTSYFTDNFGESGALMIADTLKLNTPLTTLDLGCKY
jgi:hypothetical protein